MARRFALGQTACYVRIAWEMMQIIRRKDKSGGVM